MPACYDRLRVSMRHQSARRQQSGIKFMLRILTAVFMSLLPAAVFADDCVLVEAESFEKIGGWVVDQQFMDIMGSPYLLAHGLGEPVWDATTTVEWPAKAVYRVWVRT